MGLKYIDHPTKIMESQYDELKTKLLHQLLKNDVVLSLYQMGSVKHPGISDLDIICVFKNDSDCFENFRSNLNSEEKTILTHGIFGIEQRDLVQSMSYNLISNLKHLGGKELDLDPTKIVTNEAFKTQIALEYLVKMLITIDAQVTLKIIKLRAFLLLAKAVEFDLQLLDVKSGKLYELVQQVIQYRSQWFSSKPTQSNMTKLILNFNVELKRFLERELSKSNLYLPFETLHLPGNFSIKKNENFSVVHKGLILPNQLSFLGRKYINLQNRLNAFEYHLPFVLSTENPIHEERFQFSKQIVQTNKSNYPHFIPLTTSLSIY